MINRSETDPKLQNIFSQAYILGGSPCSGKSTIAENLSTRFDLAYYKVDDHFDEHISRCQPDRHPVMCRISKMGWNEIWMRSVQTQVQDEFEFYREQFEMILADLLDFGDGRSIILEGAAYFPDLIKTCPIDPQRIMYLVPTADFQHQYYRQRPWIHQILETCEDPEVAFENWMARDHLYGKEVLRQAKANNFRTILVDGLRGVEEITENVCSNFNLSDMGVED